MARTTGKTKAAAKSPTATSTTPVMPSDDPNTSTTSSLAAPQETSTPVQVPASNLNTTTKKTKALAGSKTASLDHAALLARLAEKEGE
jgi:hypothetical protein